MKFDTERVAALLALCQSEAPQDQAWGWEELSAYLLPYMNHVANVCAERFGQVNWRHAEDIAVDVWISLYTHIHTIQGASHLRGWLWTTTRNKVIDARRYGFEGHERVVDDTTVVAPHPTCTIPEIHDDLYSALCQLPVPMQQALVLCSMYNMPHEEAAARLGVPLSTLKSRVFYGLRRLRELMSVAP